MAHTFSYEFSTTGTPEEARARLQGVITERLRRPTGGSTTSNAQHGGGATSNAQHQLRLSKQTATSLSYKPKLLVPLPISLSVWLGRVIRGEHVDVTFSAAGSDEGTHMTVSGKVGRASEQTADREFWAGVLNA